MSSSSPPNLEQPWHRLAVDTIRAQLGTDLERGLTDAEVRNRLARTGPNELPEGPPPSALRVLLAQFSSLIIWVLIGAAVVSGMLQEWVDAGAILAIVVLNALLGFVQEFRAERSLAALKRLSITLARVVRDGTVRTVPSRELVPGDLVVVDAGDHVPADARLIQAAVLRTQEAALTGESTPVEKHARVLDGQGEVSLGDRTNMLFLGTDVTSGRARALVVATGRQTELGRIATLMQETGPEPTPLQRRLDRLGHVLVYLTFGIVGIVFALGLLRGEALVQMFLTAVSLAVAAIPEGLPAIVTITLALGVTRMVTRHALIRRLPAVETLGSTTVICTDKTGTLTKNEMTVTTLYAGGHWLSVTGEGYTPAGTIQETQPVAEGRTGRATEIVGGTEALASGVVSLLRAAVLCNGAELVGQPDGWRMVGDPTEGALLVAAAKGGLLKDTLVRAAPDIAEVPFDPERKMMTIVRKTAHGPVAYVKGAPDVLLEHCTMYRGYDGATHALDHEVRGDILDANDRCAREALRVLALAERAVTEADDTPDGVRAETVERDLTFLGLMAMKDPLRPEAREAVRTCEQAGIRTVMITGDHKSTALAIGRELALMDGAGQALSGVELDRLTDEALTECVELTPIYARVSAEHKLRVIRAWKARGAVVAMTGDGVNDAPAVKQADIGVAMGLTGTDVTKEAADMVVTDDNFASIAAAVEEGRVIFDNIRKAVHYLLSCNISEVVVMLVAGLLGLPLPLMPVQILWINLVTDGFPALALAVDPKGPDVMRRPPRRSDSGIVNRSRMAMMFAQGSFLAALSVGVFGWSLYVAEESVEGARTLAFTVLVVTQLCHALNCRSDRHSLFAIGLASNRALLGAIAGSALLQVSILTLPAAQEIFKVTSLSAEHWAIVLGIGVLPLVFMEIWKRNIRARPLSDPDLS